MYRQRLFPCWGLIEVLAMRRNVNGDELESVSWARICVTVNYRILCFSTPALLPASLTNECLIAGGQDNVQIHTVACKALSTLALPASPASFPPSLSATPQPTPAFLPLQETSAPHHDSVPSCPPLAFPFHMPHLAVGSHLFGTFPGHPTNFPDYRFPSLNYF